MLVVGLPNVKWGPTGLDVGYFGDVVSPCVRIGSSPFVACSGGRDLVVVVPTVLRSDSTMRSSSGGWCIGLLVAQECSGRRPEVGRASKSLLADARYFLASCSWSGP